MASQVFRAGVVIVVRHARDRAVLAFERADAPGSWQLPQGGIDVGEDPVAAAWRELGEETSLTDTAVRLVDEHPEWVAYEWPVEVRALQGRDGKRRGQVQKWVLFEALAASVEPTPDGDEFVAWQWVSPEWLVDHVIEFRRPAYGRVLPLLIPAAESTGE